MRRFGIAVLLLAGLLAAPARAQVAPLKLPAESPAASVVQTVGMTQVEVRYARPAVKGRTIWGTLVPWGEVWRAGANENTTLSVSSPVVVAGTTLPAGTYGLHAIPGEKEWTFVLSKQAKAWGSYGYDPKEDALRFPVVPEPAPFVERLQYTLDDPTGSTVVVALRWESLRLPFRLEFDTKSVVVASLRDQLRGAPQFFWQGWNQAAAWCLKNDTNLDEALAWADRSIAIQPNYSNQSTKAKLLEKRGDPKGAAELRAKAEAMATEVEINALGYELMGAGKSAEAIAVFERNTRDHPESWNAWDSLAEAKAAAGDRKGARANYAKALARVRDEVQKKRIAAELEKLK